MKYVIIHYNTPALTRCLIYSLFKNGIMKDIVVFENSNAMPLHGLTENTNIHTFHNETGDIIDFTYEVKKFIHDCKIPQSKLDLEAKCANFGSFKHALTVEWLIQHLCDDFFLLDSDILIKQDFSYLADNTKVFVGGTTQYRVLPFLLYLNPELLNHYRIHFCDRVRIHPNIRNWNTDTGGSFWTDCQATHAPHTIINLDDFIVHYGSGSWRSTCKSQASYQGDFKTLSSAEWLLMHKHLFSNS